MAIENMSFRPPTDFNMFQSNHEEQDHLPLPAHHQFHGTYVRVSTDNGSNNMPFLRRSVSLSGLEHGQEAPVMRVHGGGDDDLSDDGSQMVGERKKRLSLDQVKALEKSFERGNKLEPERKVQLSRALGLQPRQVAIWFQNRRARWKTKQLERDYEGLRKQYDAMRSDNECLRVENEKLQSELVALKRRYNDRAPTIQKSNNGSHENRPISNSGHGHLGPLLRPTTATKQFHHGHNVVLEDSFCTMFGNGGGGMEDNQGFWSWNNTLTDHHHNLFH